MNNHQAVVRSDHELNFYSENSELTNAGSKLNEHQFMRQTKYEVVSVKVMLTPLLPLLPLPTQAGYVLFYITGGFIISQHHQIFHPHLQHHQLQTSHVSISNHCIHTAIMTIISQNKLWNMIQLYHSTFGCKNMLDECNDLLYVLM